MLSCHGPALENRLQDWVHKVDNLLDKASRSVERERRRAELLEAQNMLLRARSVGSSASTSRRQSRGIFPQEATNLNVYIPASSSMEVLPSSRWSAIKQAMGNLDNAYINRMEQARRAQPSQYVNAASSSEVFAPGRYAAIKQVSGQLDIAYLSASGSTSSQRIDMREVRTPQKPLTPQQQMAIKDAASCLDETYISRIGVTLKSGGGDDARLGKAKMVVTQGAPNGAATSPSKAHRPAESLASLWEAIKNDEATGVKARFNQDIHGELLNKCFGKAAHLAIEAGAQQAFQALLELHVEQLARDSYQHSLKAQLLQRQAACRANACNASGQSLLASLLRQDALEQEMVAQLLQAKADPLQRDHSGATPFLACAEAGHVQFLRMLGIVTQGAAVTASDDAGQTALHKAASKGHGTVVNALLQMQMDPSVCDVALQTPLDVAKDEDVARLLRGDPSDLPGDASAARQAVPVGSSSSDSSEEIVHSEEEV